MQRSTSQQIPSRLDLTGRERMAGHAEYLHGDVNPYQLQGISDGNIDQRNPRGDAGLLPPRKPLPPQHSNFNAHDHRRRHRQTIAATARPQTGTTSSRSEHRKSLSKLEGRQSFSFAPRKVDDWSKLNFGDEIPAEYHTKLMRKDPTKPGQKTSGLVRSLSQKVKSLTTQRRASVTATPAPPISGPLDCQDFDPRYSHCSLHPDLKAIPIKEAQRRFGATAHSETPAPVEGLREYHAARGHPAFDCGNTIPPPAPKPQKHAEGGTKIPHALRRMKAFKSTRGTEIKPRPLPPLPSPPPHPPQPQSRTIKVLGDPDRMTVFGDFIDYEDEVSDDADRAILEIQPLRLSTSVRRRRTISRRDRATNTDEPSPTVRALVDEIEEQIASASPVALVMPRSLRPTHRLRQSSRRPEAAGPSSGMNATEDGPADEEEEMNEMRERLRRLMREST